MSTERKPPDGLAIGLMVVLTATWGLAHVVAKLTEYGMSLVMQGGVRSVIALVLLVIWSRLRGVPLLSRDGTLFAGLVAGLLFALEFITIFYGLAYTGASRMTVFVNLNPCITALGLHFLMASERMSPLRWVGVAFAFAGVTVTFAEGFASQQSTWLGDLCGVIAAILWASTIIVIRCTRLASASAEKTMFYQTAAAALLLPPVSMLIGEPGIIAVDGGVVASMFYQGVIVTFVTYLAWFWLLTRYMASRLSVFTALSPLFGVAGGVLLLGEPLTPLFVAGSVLVVAGLYLVNRK